jgi:hypothetical protein
MPVLVYPKLPRSLAFEHFLTDKDRGLSIGRAPADITLLLKAWRGGA